MENEKNVLCAEMLLAKYFADHGTEDLAQAASVIRWVKRNTKGQNLRRSEIREARKKLGIKSTQVNGVYMWCWMGELEPTTVWTEKSEGFLNARERY